MAIATTTRKAASSTRTRTTTAKTTAGTETKATRRTMTVSARGVGTTTTAKTTTPSITAELKFRDPAAIEMLDKMFQRTGANANDLLQESLSWFVDNNLNVLTPSEKKQYSLKHVIAI